MKLPLDFFWGGAAFALMFMVKAVFDKYDKKHVLSEWQDLGKWAVLIVSITVGMTHFGRGFEQVLPTDLGWAVLIGVVLIVVGVIVYMIPVTSNNLSVELFGGLIVAVGYLVLAVTLSGYLGKYDWNLIEYIIWIVGPVFVVEAVMFAAGSWYNKHGGNGLLDIALLLFGGIGLLVFGVSAHRALEQWDPGFLWPYATTLITGALVLVLAGISVLLVSDLEENFSSGP